MLIVLLLFFIHFVDAEGQGRIERVRFLGRKVMQKIC